MDVFSQPVAIVLLCTSAYLAGSVLFAIPVCRLWKLPDPRALGSGNPGATNVYRAGGWQPALATLVLDAFKGWLPVWLGQSLGMSILVQAMIALCAVTGHMIPAFYRFKGGKGVATAEPVGHGPPHTPAHHVGGAHHGWESDRRGADDGRWQGRPTKDVVDHELAREKKR